MENGNGESANVVAANATSCTSPLVDSNKKDLIVSITADGHSKSSVSCSYNKVNHNKPESSDNDRECGTKVVITSTDDVETMADHHAGVGEFHSAA